MAPGINWPAVVWSRRAVQFQSHQFRRARCSVALDLAGWPMICSNRANTNTRLSSPRRAHVLGAPCFHAKKNCHFLEGRNLRSPLPVVFGLVVCAAVSWRDKRRRRRRQNNKSELAAPFCARALVATFELERVLANRNTCAAPGWMRVGCARKPAAD